MDAHTKNTSEKQKKITIGYRLRNIREARHMSMNSVARHSKISVGNVSKIEHGIHLPKFNTLQSLAKCFNMTDEELFERLGINYTHNHKVTEYKKVPVIPSIIKMPDEAIKNPVDYRNEIPSEVPKHCFIIKCCNNLFDSIKKGSLILIDTDFKYQDRKFYAVQLDDKLIFGRIYKSHGMNYGVFVNDHSDFFNIDYKGRFKVLGQAVSITHPM